MNNWPKYKRICEGSMRCAITPFFIICAIFLAIKEDGFKPVWQRFRYIDLEEWDEAKDGIKHWIVTGEIKD